MTADAAPKLVRCAPYLPAGDLLRTTEYYERVFGFTREYLGGSPPVFAIVSRDGHPVMLRLLADPGRIVPMEKQGGTWDAFFWVQNVDALHAELQGNGADVVYGPVDQQYGVREFAVRDPDGHVLGFGEPIQAIR